MSDKTTAVKDWAGAERLPDGAIRLTPDVEGAGWWDWVTAGLVFLLPALVVVAFAIVVREAVGGSLGNFLGLVVFAAGVAPLAGYFFRRHYRQIRVAAILDDATLTLPGGMPKAGETVRIRLEQRAKRRTEVEGVRLRLWSLVAPHDPHAEDSDAFTREHATLDVPVGRMIDPGRPLVEDLELPFPSRKEVEAVIEPWLEQERIVEVDLDWHADLEVHLKEGVVYAGALHFRTDLPAVFGKS